MPELRLCCAEHPTEAFYCERPEGHTRHHLRMDLLGRIVATWGGPEHVVTVRLLRTRWGTPWKWQGRCTCGWACLSWQWDRAWLSAYDPAWITEAQVLTGGAMPMSLDHLARAA